jgi:hypothetical protein
MIYADVNSPKNEKDPGNADVDFALLDTGIDPNYH